jgi:hypothetical protein
MPVNARIPVPFSERLSVGGSVVAGGGTDVIVGET